MSRVLDAIRDEYYDWMCSLVLSDRRVRRRSYSKLLRYLHEREFVYILDMDGNRAEDGVDLRYRFAYDNRYTYPVVASYLDDGPCSILEMMVALALRCEEHIMDDPDIGNRTGEWFWDMISSLGLWSMTDSKFDESFVEKVIDRFLDRRYNRNGEGGLFTVEGCEHDLRTVEIWYQMCSYLNTR